MDEFYKTETKIAEGIYFRAATPNQIVNAEGTSFKTLTKEQKFDPTGFLWTNLSFFPLFLTFFFAFAAFPGIEGIEQEIARLENSVKHLLRSNEEMKEFLESEEQEDQLVAVSIKENEVTIKKQKIKISLLKAEADKYYRFKGMTL